MFYEAAEEAVSKSQSEKPRFWSDTTEYYLDLNLGKAYDTVANNDNWKKTKMMLRRLTDSLKRMAEIESVPDSDRIAAELRRHGLSIVRKGIETIGKTFDELDQWERHEACWRCEFEEDEALRDEGHARMASAMEWDAGQWTLEFTEFLQPTIDEIREAVIRHDEKGQAAVRDQNDELTRLRERVAKLKEYTP